MAADEFGFEADEVGFVPDAPVAPEGPSRLKSGLLGAAQGATLGFADELEGAAKTAIDLQAMKDALSQGSLDPITKTYEANRDIARGEYKEAEEANPGTYFAGNLGGGVASALLPGGILAKAGAGLKGAITAGAGAGALGALGTSEQDPLSLGTAGEVAGGAVLGGALGGIGEAGAKALGNLARKYDLPKKVLRSFEKGVEGKNLNTIEAKDKIRQEALDAANEAVNDIKQATLQRADVKREMLKDSGKSINLDKELQIASDEIEAALASGEITEETAAQLKKVVDAQRYSQAPSTEKNVASVKTVKTTREGKDGKLRTSTTTTTSAKGKAPEELDAVLDEITSDAAEGVKLNSSMTEGSNFKKIATTETIDNIKDGVLRGEIPLDEALTRVQNLQNAAFSLRNTDPGKAKILKGLARRLSNSLEEAAPDTAPFNKEISAGIEALENLGEPELVRGLGKSQASNQTLNFVNRLSDDLDPKALKESQTVFELLKKMDPDVAAKIETRLRGAAEDLDLAGLSSNAGISTNPINLITGSATAGAVKASNLLGQIAGKASKVIGKNTQAMAGAAKQAVGRQAVAAAQRDSGVVSSYDVDVPEGEIARLSQALSGSNDATDKALSQELTVAQGKSPQMRRAMMWKIMQNPHYREKLKGLRSQ